eukprot:2531734-Alexandrium_andersonii.AAC.1
MPARGSVQDNEGHPALGPRRHGRLLGSLGILWTALDGGAWPRAARRRGCGAGRVLLWVRVYAG